MLKYLLATHHVLALVFTFVDDPIIFRPTGRYALTQGDSVHPEKPETPASEPVQESKVPVFSLECWHASWCQYCPAAIAEAKAAAADLGIPLVLIDFDQNRAVLAQAGIDAPPTLCIVNSGKIQERIKGGARRADIVAKVRDWQRRWGQPVTYPVAPVAAPLPEVSYSNPVSEIGRYTTYGNRTYDWANETYYKCVLGNRCGMCVYLYNACWSYRNAKGLAKIEEPSPQSSSHVDVVDDAIAIMRLTPDDVVAELGSGNGMVAIRMVQRSGCRVIGVEIDPLKVAESRRNIENAGLTSHIDILERDVRQFDPAEFKITATYSYLYPELLNEIIPALSYGRVTVCPGHKPDGLDAKLIGQCWVRESDSQNHVVRR